MMYVIYSEGVKSNKIYNKTQNFLICISGDSGSGKSTLISLLVGLIKPDQGEILIEALGGEPGELPVNVGNIATLVPEEGARLKKTLDGHIRYEPNLNEDGTEEIIPIEPNQQAKLTSGFLEKSNVNAIEEMVNTIDQMRKFEMHVKMIQMTEELDAAGASLMRLPGL